MRWSRYFLQTVREVPGDAEAVSHVLLTRAGMMRRIAAGIYALTPLGLRAHRKTEAIVREEMDRSGALELELPILAAARALGGERRWARYTAEAILFHLEDRRENEYCLAAHRRGSVHHPRPRGHDVVPAAPFTLYQIRTKFRDEIRPRFGLMRGREFLMYDGYSFDADAAGLDPSYRAQDAAYRRIFERCGLDYIVSRPTPAASAAAVPGVHGPRRHRGGRCVRCAACGYGANVEQALTGRRPAPWETRRSGPSRRRRDAREGRYRRRRRVPRITASRMIKCLVYDRKRVSSSPSFGGPRRQRGRAEACPQGRAPGARLGGEGRGGRGARRLRGGPHHLAGEGLRVVADESVRGAVNAVTGAGRRTGTCWASR